MLKNLTCSTKKILLMTVLALSLTMLAPASIPGNPITTNVSAKTKLKISRKSLSLNPGQKSKLKVTGTKKKVKWTSSNKKVVTVSSKGIIKAKKCGTAKIKAKVSGKTFTCKVKVTKPQAVTSRTGQTSSNGITYDVVFKSNGYSSIKITNNSGYNVSRGWTGNFGITIKTTTTQYNIGENTLQSLINTNDIKNQTIYNGSTCTLTGTFSNISGTVTSVSIYNLYPLQGSGLPYFDYSSFSYVTWGATVNLK